MKAKLITTIIVLNLISAGFLSADSHEEALTVEEELEQATRQWNQAMNKGEWEKHFSYFAIGCNEFWGRGMLRSRFNNEEKYANLTNALTEWNNKGGDRFFAFKDVRAKVHGDTAVVTTYAHGWVQQPEKERDYSLLKISIIWNKSTDGWKIVHTHWSKLKADYDD